VVQCQCFPVLRPAGYAFSTYGEVAACWVQDIVLVGLIARHMRTGHKRLAAAAAAFAVYCWWLVSGLCSVETLTGAGPRHHVWGVGAEQFLGAAVCHSLHVMVTKHAWPPDPSICNRPSSLFEHHAPS
jgi:hypothetical protein